MPTTAPPRPSRPEPTSAPPGTPAGTAPPGRAGRPGSAVRSTGATAGTVRRMDNTARLAALAKAVGRFGDLTEAADLDAQVPTCAGWDVTTVVGHLVEVHTWVRKLLEGDQGFGAF